jgi:hypothetical protein
MDKIFVENQAQRVLMECELKGQLSDGAWENATPQSHWKRPCAAEVVVATDIQETGLTWHGRKSYAFDRRDLLDAVGDRMIYWVKFYSAFPVLAADFHNHWDFYMSDGWPTIPGEYWDKKRATFLRLTGCATYEEAMAKINAVQYTTTDLRRDLRALKVIFAATIGQ